MIYDSIEMYSEALESNGHLQGKEPPYGGLYRQNQHISIYALVLGRYCKSQSVGAELMTEFGIGVATLTL
jgi:hypothetical protein